MKRFREGEVAIYKSLLGLKEVHVMACETIDGFDATFPYDCFRRYKYVIRMKSGRMKLVESHKLISYGDKEKNKIKSELLNKVII